MLQVRTIQKKVWLHTAMEKAFNKEISALAKKLSKDKSEVLNALVAQGLKAAKATKTTTATKARKATTKKKK